MVKGAIFYDRFSNLNLKDDSKYVYAIMYMKCVPILSAKTQSHMLFLSHRSRRDTKPYTPNVYTANIALVYVLDSNQLQPHTNRTHTRHLPL